MYTDLINNKTDYEFLNPKTIVPTPNKTDYETGFLERYYCQKINDSKGFVFEINYTTFKELQDNPFWKVVILRWRIKGPVNVVYNNADIANLIMLARKGLKLIEMEDRARRINTQMRTYDGKLNTNAQSDPVSADVKLKDDK